MPPPFKNPPRPAADPPPIVVAITRYQGEDFQRGPHPRALLEGFIAGAAEVLDAVGGLGEAS